MTGFRQWLPLALLSASLACSCARPLELGFDGLPVDDSGTDDTDTSTETETEDPDAGLPSDASPRGDSGVTD